MAQEKMTLEDCMLPQPCLSRVRMVAIMEPSTLRFEETVIVRVDSQVSDRSS